MNDNGRARRPAAVDTADVAALFDAVSDQTRLALLRLVVREEHCVSQCTEHIGLTHSAISKQLNALSVVGLLTRRPAGRRSYYRVTDPEAVEGILEAAEWLISKRSHG